MICLNGIDTVSLKTGIPRDIFNANLRLTKEYVKWVSSLWDEFYQIMKESFTPRVVWEMFFVKVCQA